jgi:hypothetical protein
VPVWHEQTQALRDEGKLQLVGLIQEQHPDRCRLFMQWHEMGWPIMVDSLDELGVARVPIVVLIDEHGIVRSVRPDMDAVNEFANAPLNDVDPAAPSTRPDLGTLRDRAKTGELLDLIDCADALVTWGDDADLTDAIDTDGLALEARPDLASIHFHLGVAYRRRFESTARAEGDFARAIEHWENALALDPNQYIWRRRIQQYGPRLDKPYSFYDWVNEARQAITARGDTPAPLRVEPSGAELAYPAEVLDSAADATEPDPEGDIQRDEGLIHAEVIAVPTTQGDGAAWRIHVFTPHDAAHWNNEAEPMSVWLDAPKGWTIDHRLATLDAPPTATSTETRTAEFELRPPPDSAPETPKLRGYALYNVCEDAEGACLYRRLDFETTLRR